MTIFVPPDGDAFWMTATHKQVQFEDFTAGSSVKQADFEIHLETIQFV